MIKKSIIIILLVFTSVETKAQNRKQKKVKKVVKEENMFDIFSKSVSPLITKSGKKMGFLELLDSTKMSTEDKKQHQNMYDLMKGKDLTKKQKDSISNLILREMTPERIKKDNQKKK